MHPVVHSFVTHLDWALSLRRFILGLFFCSKTLREKKKKKEERIKKDKSDYNRQIGQLQQESICR